MTPCTTHIPDRVAAHLDDDASAGGPEAGVEPPYAAAVRGDRPVGYWRAGEAPSQITILDATGNGREGLLVGAWTLGVPGALTGDPDTALRLRGGAAHVNGAAFTFDANAPFTIELWASADVVDGEYRVLVSHGVAPAGYSMWLRRPTGEAPSVCFVRGDAAERDFTCAEAGRLPDGAFHHVVASYDGETSVLYLDGSPLASQPSRRPIPARPTPLVIGGTQARGSFLGVADEIAVYDRALAPERVRDHYRIGTAER